MSILTENGFREISKAERGLAQSVVRDLCLRHFTFELSHEVAFVKCLSAFQILIMQACPE